MPVLKSIAAASLSHFYRLVFQQPLRKMTAPPTDQSVAFVASLGRSGTLIRFDELEPIRKGV